MSRVSDAAELAGQLDWDKAGGLVPLIVQHAHDGRVLMLGYTDRDALALTLATGEVHFHSRSRNATWRKGETSGHVLRLVSIACDCDADALLCQALPQGPTCHRGSDSCFDGSGATHPWLVELERLIDARMSDGDATGGGYTRQLLAAGVQRVAQKVGEEGVETALAGAVGPDDALAGEAADLVFHLMVLLRMRGLSLRDVVATLAQRHGKTGHAEQG